MSESVHVWSSTSFIRITWIVTVYCLRPPLILLLKHCDCHHSMSSLPLFCLCCCFLSCIVRLCKCYSRVSVAVSFHSTGPVPKAICIHCWMCLHPRKRVVEAHLFGVASSWPPKRGPTSAPKVGASSMSSANASSSSSASKGLPSMSGSSIVVVLWRLAEGSSPTIS